MEAACALKSPFQKSSAVVATPQFERGFGRRTCRKHAEEAGAKYMRSASFTEGTEINRPRSASIGVRSRICSGSAHQINFER